jgi:hypothetical protein
VSGERDQVFTPDLTQRYVDRLREHGLSPSWTRLGCAHYTLGTIPYSALALLSTVTHLRRTLWETHELFFQSSSAPLKVVAAPAGRL